MIEIENKADGHDGPKLSPSAHNAFYDVERFLAFMGSINGESAKTEKSKLNKK